ncbi:MAG: hypothetical protein JXQ75_21170 [Phycisphaerae bacterium]|nr:hypothetical protein [Phycisphaerae bacterium]
MKHSGHGYIRPIASFRRPIASFSLAVVLVICSSAIFALCPACDISVLTGAPSEMGFSVLNLRVENATTSFASVTITPGLEASTSAGQAEADSESDDGATVIRVPPGSVSNGTLQCASSTPQPWGFSVRATVGTGQTPPTVLFEGDGTGTPGFDDGSIGAEGERFLVRGAHYGCGDTVVIRVTDDGTRAGAGTSGAPQGIIKHYALGETVPPSSLEPDEPTDGAGGGTDGDGSGGDGQTTDQATGEVHIQITNQTDYVMQVLLASASAAEGEGVPVHVPPNSTTTGATTCYAQFTMTATTIVFDGGEEENPPRVWKYAHVILTGAGTGVPGFDEGCIGGVGERTFVRGEHFNCDDMIVVTISDPGEPQPNIAEAVVGTGTVSVTSGQ